MSMRGITVDAVCCHVLKFITEILFFFLCVCAVCGHIYKLKVCVKDKGALLSKVLRSLAL